MKNLAALSASKRTRPLHLILVIVAVMAYPLAAGAQAGALVNSGPETIVNTTLDDEQNDPVIGVRSSGFVVVWESYSQVTPDLDSVVLRLFDTAGAPLADEMVVNVNSLGDRADPAVAVHSDGSFVVVWDSDGGQDGDGKGIFARRFDSAGQPIDLDDVLINQATAGDQNDPVIAMQNDGSFLVVWESITPPGSTYDVVGRRFNADGTPIGDQFQINVHTPNDQEDIAVAVDASNRFVVVWESEGQDFSYDAVIGRRLASDGSLLGSEFQVNTYTPFDQANPDLAARPDGSFVVVWEDDAQDTPGTAVFARTFDASDDPLPVSPDEFQIDTYSYGTYSYGQFFPSVDFLPNGDFVVVWASDYQDGSGAGIFRNQFDTSGTRLGGETRVNTSTDGFQVEPRIAVGADSSFVVWSDFGYACCSDIVSQALVPTTFADGFESGDLASWSSSAP